LSNSPLRSPHGKQDDGEYSHAEDYGRDPGNFDVEGTPWVKCHALSLAAIGRQQH
jgi:hypothetical protein